jgi:hypothetical protein
MSKQWMTVGLAMLVVAFAGCGESSSHTATSNNGSERYGPACKHELVSAACIEEEEAKKKPLEERARKEQQKALSQEQDEIAQDNTEQEKESEEYGPSGARNPSDMKSQLSLVQHA